MLARRSNASAFGLRLSAGKAGLLSRVACFAAVLAPAACDNPNYTKLYATQPLAPSYTAADVAALNHMGATVVDDGINFSTYSENATKIQVALFNNATDQLPAQQFDLQPAGNHVWNLFVEGVGVHQAYGYIAWGPNWPYDASWNPGSIAGFVSDVDAKGNRFDPNKLLLDPWAQMATGPFNWSDASAASGPDRATSTFQAAGKALTVDSQYAWSANEATWLTARQNPNMPGHRWQDQIVYEMHPKGFTASPASGVMHPGTFRGIGENVSYLKDLGITAVELMPSHWKSTDGGYWGYNTIGFFIPELTYSSVNDPTDPEGPIDEFKWMVDTLHQNGIEVLLDVVFNHTGEGGLWQDEIQFDDVPPLPDGDPQLTAFTPNQVASILSWRGLDNQAYYALSDDYQTYWDNSGVGQDTRANHTPFTRMIMDSLHYWVSQMHVDGFRFDEAAVLGEDDEPGQSCTPGPCYNNWNNPADTVLQTIADDPLFHQQNIRVVAEPWSGGGDYQGSYPASTTEPGYGWGEWNGPFRDWWRSFMDCDGTQGQCTCNGAADCVCNAPNCNYDSSGNPIPWTLNTAIWTPNGNVSATGGFFLYGSEGLFQPNGRKPYHSYNFVTIHDGFTMYDALSYNDKVNGCGPLNPFCCTNPTSSYCQTDDGVDNNLSRDWGHCSTGTQCGGSDTCNSGQCANGEDVKRELMRNLFVAMLVSNGTPLLLGGDEWERTQLGNNNPYSTLADNSYNWFDWGSWQPDQDRNRMHDFVRQLIALRKQFSAALAPADWGSGPTVSWEDASSSQPCAGGGGTASDGLCTANWNSRHIAVHYPPSSSSAELDILINMETSPTNFTLPPGNWTLLVDTQTYYDDDSYFTGNPKLDPTKSDNIWLASPTAIPGGAYNVMPQSIVIAQGAPATP